MAIYCYLIANSCYTLFDDGLANLLCLQTLRHGTNPVNNIAIRIFGANPEKSGSDTGATKTFSPADPRGYFFVIKDDEYNEVVRSLPPPYKFNNQLAIAFVKRISCYMFSSNSCMNLSRTLVTSNLALSVLSLFAFLVSPTIRFRFNHIDRTRFLDDMDMKATPDPDMSPEINRPVAYKTAQKIEAWRIGTLGSLLSGVNLEWFSRVQRQPTKMLRGVVQLVISIAIATLFRSYLRTHSLAAFAGVILA
jgi:hypothetical protein